LISISRHLAPLDKLSWKVELIVQVQDTRLRMPNKWHICKEGQEGNKSSQLLRRERRPLLNVWD
jgi:hypothetical protein